MGYASSERIKKHLEAYKPRIMPEGFIMVGLDGKVTSASNHFPLAPQGLLHLDPKTLTVDSVQEAIAEARRYLFGKRQRDNGIIDGMLFDFDDELKNASGGETVDGVMQVLSKHCDLTDGQRASIRQSIEILKDLGDSRRRAHIALYKEFMKVLDQWQADPQALIASIRAQMDERPELKPTNLHGEMTARDMIGGVGAAVRMLPVRAQLMLADLRPVFFLDRNVSTVLGRCKDDRFIGKYFNGTHFICISIDACREAAMLSKPRSRAKKKDDLEWLDDLHRETNVLQNTCFEEVMHCVQHHLLTDEQIKPFFAAYKKDMAAADAVLFFNRFASKSSRSLQAHYGKKGKVTRAAEYLVELSHIERALMTQYRMQHYIQAPTAQQQDAQDDEARAYARAQISEHLPAMGALYARYCEKEDRYVDRIVKKITKEHAPERHVDKPRNQRGRPADGLSRE